MSRQNLADLPGRRLQSKIVAQGDESDTVSAHILNRRDQVLQAATEPVELPADDRIECPRMGGASMSLPGSAYVEVDELGGCFPGSTIGIFAQLRQLHFGVLVVKCGDSSVNGDALALFLRERNGLVL